MNRRTAALIVLAGVGCHPRPDPTLERKMDQVLAELEQFRTENRELTVKVDALSAQATAAQTATAMKLEELERVRPASPPPPVPPAPRRTFDPAAVYAVPIAGSPVLGKDTAHVTLVEFTDFACPFCKRSRDTLAALQAKYGAELRIVHKDFVVHPQVATDAAYAGCAAARQNKYFDLADLIWNKGWDGTIVKDISAGELKLLAAEAGLDMDRFGKDVNGPECHRRIADDAALASTLGVSGTPMFFVNGRPLSGAQPLDVFVRLIDEELPKAQASKLKGADYYESLVKSGRSSI